MSGVGVTNGNSLIFIGKVLDNALCKDVERSAKQYVVGGFTNNMDLEI